MDFRIIKRDKKTIYSKNEMTVRHGAVPKKLRLSKNHATEEAIHELIVTLMEQDV